MKRPLLILRPEPGAAATAALARAAGFDCLCRPLFRVLACPWDAPDPSGFDAVMMTSANAARHGGPALDAYRHLPLYAVGAPTARAAAERDFADIVAGDSDGVALVERMARDGRRQVLHFAGVDRIGLTSAEVAISVRAVYRSAAIDPPPPLADAIARRPVALVHSPRAARRLAEIVADRAAVRIAAISARALAAAGDGWAAGASAAAPTDDALLAVAARLCD